MIIRQKRHGNRTHAVFIWKEKFLSEQGSKGGRMDLKEQFYGTEIEMTGITRKHAAEVVSEMFGTSIYHRSSYDSWCLLDREGKEWKFVSDSSINPERRAGRQMVPAGLEYCTEMVSPKLAYGEMGKLQEVVRCLRMPPTIRQGASKTH